VRVIEAIKPGSASKSLRLVEAPDPTPGPGQLLVRPAAIGLNFIDIYRRSGLYKMSFPHVPGSEGAGEVVAAGEGSTEASGLRVGSPVAWASSVSGSYGELVVIAADQALPVPEGLDIAVAAALPLQGMTADYLVRSVFPVGPEHTVAFYAAAGGVGLLAGQMIRTAGGRLLAVVGNAAKASLLMDDGVPPADIVTLGAMRNVTEELPKAIRACTQELGADAVFDSIGRDTFAASLRSLRRRGTLVLFGASSGPVAPFDPQYLNAHGSLFLTRPSLGDYTASRDELLERSGRVFAAAAEGRLSVRVGARFPLAEAAAAQAALESRATTGKVLIVP
jgi:NADPH2:quinone reductase